MPSQTSSPSIHGDRRARGTSSTTAPPASPPGCSPAGVGEGAKVALDLYNCSEFFEAFFAAVKLGAVPVNVNYRYRDEELRQLLDDADVEVVIAHASLADRVRQIAPRLPRLRRIVEVRRPRDADRPASDYEHLIGGHATRRPAPSRRGGMYLSYTGGTTGLPKGVMYEMARRHRATRATRAMICGVDVDWDGRGPLAAASSCSDRGGGLSRCRPRR